MDITALPTSAMGTTTGSAKVFNEKCPEAQAANSNPGVTEKVQLRVPANIILFHRLIATHDPVQPHYFTALACSFLPHNSVSLQPTDSLPAVPPSLRESSPAKPAAVPTRSRAPALLRHPPRQTGCRPAATRASPASTPRATNQVAPPLADLATARPRFPAPAKSAPATAQSAYRIRTPRQRKAILARVAPSHP